MADTSILTAEVIVRRRSLLGRIVKLPTLFRSHYRTLRQHNGIVVSLYGAWLMASLVITVRTGNGLR